MIRIARDRNARVVLALVGVASLGWSGCASTRSAAATTTEPGYVARDHIDEGPARLVGQDADLTLKDGVLAGLLEGGAYNVKVTADSARGQGPLGAIDLHIKRGPKGYDLSGLWNGGNVHFLVGENGAKGHLMKQISGEDPGVESCEYDIAKLPARAGYSGLSFCLGDDGPLRFEVQPRSTSDMTQEQNAILLLAYFAAPPPVRTL